MTVMFDRLLGYKKMDEYLVLEDQMHTGDEDILTYGFVKNLIQQNDAQFYLYVTKRISENIYKSRFIVFKNIAQRMRFVIDNSGNGSSFIDELAQTFLN